MKCKKLKKKYSQCEILIKSVCALLRFRGNNNPKSRDNRGRPGVEWGELSWASKGEILVNSDHVGRILGRGQPGWAPVRRTASADAKVYVRDGSGEEALDDFDARLNIHTGRVQGWGA